MSDYKKVININVYKIILYTEVAKNTNTSISCKEISINLDTDNMSDCHGLVEQVSLHKSNPHTKC